MHIQMMCKLYYNLIIAVCSECSLNQLPNSFTLYSTDSSGALHVGLSEEAKGCMDGIVPVLKVEAICTCGW